MQRGSIIVDGVAIATSVPSDDVYSFQRVYTDADMWAPVTGYINPALGAATGIEQAMNPELSGTDGSQFLSRIERIVSGQAPRGSNVLLSLDAAAQRAAYEGLQGLQGAVLAIEPATGRILAMATSPSFDTNLLATHNTTDALATYDALDADPGDPLSNRAIAGDLNPPGSTFKLVTAATAFASGEWTPESTLPNPAVYQLPQSSSTVQNAWGGTCGPGADGDDRRGAAAELQHPVRGARRRARRPGASSRCPTSFGFNRSFEMPLLSTAVGLPARPWMTRRPPSRGFGQGQVIATPLQMAMVSAGIANEGVVMNPRMVDRVIGPDLAVQQTFDDTEFGRALDADIAREMVTLMVRNVSDGAASGARIEGVDVAGKTGTAENGEREPYTLWFTGFAPADNPQVAVAVVVENGGGQGQSGSGDTIAAPIAKKVMEAVLNR